MGIIASIPGIPGHPGIIIISLFIAESRDVFVILNEPLLGVRGMLGVTPMELSPIAPLNLGGLTPTRRPRWLTVILTSTSITVFTIAVACARRPEMGLLFVRVVPLGRGHRRGMFRPDIIARRSQGSRVIHHAVPLATSLPARGDTTPALQLVGVGRGLIEAVVGDGAPVG